MFYFNFSDKDYAASLRHEFLSFWSMLHSDEKTVDDLQVDSDSL
jgi:hypothetical protein